MYIAIDVGATKIKINCYSDLNPESKVSSQELKTTRYFVKDTENILNILKKENNIKAVAIALPGFVIDKRKGIISAANLPDWENKDLVNRIGSELGTTNIFILHDGEAHAVSEYVWQEVNRDYLFIAWGTGIGATYVRKRGADIETQQIEFGFQYVNGVTLESQVGGGSLEKRFGVKPDMLTSEHWDIIINDFGEGLANIIALNYPGLIIWGGGVVFKNTDVIDKIMQTAFAKYTYWKMPEYRFAKFKDEGCVLGALGTIKLNIK